MPLSRTSASSGAQHPLGTWRPRARITARASAATQGWTQSAGAAAAPFGGQHCTAQGFLGAPLASLGLRAFLGVAIAPLAQGVFRRLFGGRRRRARQTPAKMDSSARAVLSIATYNVRGVMDRWPEREPLLRQCLHQIDADVLCFQECLTGEFGQDRRLLPAWYHVFPCKAALFNLALAGGVLRWYAHTVERLLSMPPLRRAMVSLPAAVEGWRERLRLKSDFFRTIRDMAMAPFFGNSVACRIAEAHEIKHSTLVLGDWRAAQRIEFYIGREGAEEGDGCCDGSGEAGEHKREKRREIQQAAGRQGRQRRHERALSHGKLARSGSGSGSDGERSVVSGVGGFKIWVVNTHLDHEHPDNRQRQALAVCDWMDKEKHDCAAIILCGDFNGAPHEPFHGVLRRLGYVSAHVARHGREPQGTWPTGIQAPLMDEGEFECLDYVYVWTAPDHNVRVLSAEVHGLQPAAHDKTLFPSDHAAVKATLEVSRRAPVDLQACVRQQQQQQQQQQHQEGSGGTATGSGGGSRAATGA